MIIIPISTEKWVIFCWFHTTLAPSHLQSSSAPPPPGHEVRPLNDLFGPQVYTDLVVSSMIIQVFFFLCQQVNSQGVVSGI